MTCLNERIVGATFLMFSGFSFAGGFGADAPETMLLSNIAPPTTATLAPIEQPQRYVQRYVMRYESDRRAANDRRFENFYSADIAHQFHLGSTNAPDRPPDSARPARDYLRLQSVAPQLSIVDLPNTTLTLRAQPQRRLSLTVDEWVFSATARVAILHSHSTGATVTVRRGF